MDYSTGLWALFALACCVVGYLIHRDEVQSRYASQRTTQRTVDQSRAQSHLDQRHAARKRQAQYELTFWKLLAAFASVAVVAFVLACLITL